MGVSVALTTAPSLEEAQRIGRTLVEERLVACANVVPGVASIYRWEGSVHEEGEVLLLLKTRTDGVDRLRTRLVGIHPYDVPEFIAFGVDAGHLEYLAWVRDEVDL